MQEQKMDGYNRESGQKTLQFVGGLILIIALLAVLLLLAMNRGLDLR
ncbi:MAG: hypothetical protein AAB553_04505 [Patescibacteria group bacterium]